MVLMLTDVRCLLNCTGCKVAKNEKEDIWKLFLNFVKDSLDCTLNGKTIISDQERGAPAAIRKVFPDSVQFCLQDWSKHRQENLWINTDVQTGKAFVQCINTYNDYDLNNPNLRWQKRVCDMFPTSQMSYSTLLNGVAFSTTLHRRMSSPWTTQISAFVLWFSRLAF